MSAFNAYYQNLPSTSPAVRLHLPSIEWLVSSGDADRRTGRTTALALAFLRDSFANSPSPTRVFDHVSQDISASRQLMVQRISSMYPGVYVDSYGKIESEPMYPSDPGHRYYPDTLAKVRADFRDVCTAAARLGVDTMWMMDQVRNSLAQSVMSG